MHAYTTAFVNYCKENLTIESSESNNYRSLSVCIIDCVYSLRTKYYSVTRPVVERYARKYMGGDPLAAGDTASMLLQHIEDIGGAEKFAEDVLKNHQKLGANNLPKELVCVQLAQYLKYLHIDTIEDFKNFEAPALLEIVIHAVKGIGDAGTNYLFMLAGDPNRCKPDVHIHHCIRDACGKDVSNGECQIIFTEAVTELRKEHPSLTVQGLDSVIWRKYQAAR